MMGLSIGFATSPSDATKLAGHRFRLPCWAWPAALAAVHGGLVGMALMLVLGLHEAARLVHGPWRDPAKRIMDNPYAKVVLADEPDDVRAGGDPPGFENTKTVVYQDTTTDQRLFSKAFGEGPDTGKGETYTMPAPGSAARRRR